MFPMFSICDNCFIYFRENIYLATILNTEKQCFRIKIAHEIYPYMLHPLINKVDAGIIHIHHVSVFSLFYRVDADKIMQTNDFIA